MGRRMKRAAAGVLSFLMVISMAVPVQAAWTAPTQTEWTSLGRENIKVRFAVGSDLHIGRDSNASEKLKNAFDAFYKVDDQLDAAIFCGDITNNGNTSEYKTLTDIINDKLKENTKLGLMMGNHEFNNATGAVDRYKTGVSQLRDDINAQDTRNDIVVGDGYHIITMSAKNYGGDYTDNYEWLKEHLEAAVKEDPQKPIFLMQHHGFQDTAYVTNEWYGTFGEIENLLKQYPQVIDFSGHSHATLNDPRSINQDLGFTAIQDGTIGAYFENETGKMEGTRPADSENASQALMVEVDENNKVTLRRMDLNSGSYIGKSWVVNTPELVSQKNFQYTTQKRTAESAVPTFREGAELKVSDVTETSARLTFTQGENEDRNDDGWIHSYRIRAINKETGKTELNKLTFSDYYEPPMKETLTKTVSGLSEDTAYTIEITAINPFQKESTQKLTADLKTKTSLTEEELQKEAPKADLLDVDFSDGTGKDVSAASHQMRTAGTPVISKEENLGKNAAYFDGTSAFSYGFSDDEYAQMQKGFTMECMMKLDHKGNPFSDQESAGAGFELNSDGKTLEFWSRHGSGYVKPTTQIDTSKWVHAVATYDGSYLKLYVNGKLKDTKSVDGKAWVIPAEGARYFFVGADTNKSGEIQNAIQGKVSAARIYSRALSVGEITKLYWKEAPTTLTVDSGASFEAKEGEEFLIPTATAQVKATGETAKVQVSVKDSKNQDVTISDGKIQVKDSFYKVLYTANGAVLEKTVKVTKKEEPKPPVVKAPTVDARRTLNENEGYRISIQNKAGNAKVTYSSNSSAATVSKYGYVTGKKAGTAVITTTVVQNGKTYTLKTTVTVVKKPSVIGKKTLTAGKKGYRITVKNRAKNAKVSFKIQNKKVATISRYGYLKAVRQGTTYAETTVTQNGKTYRLKTKVVVKPQIKILKSKKTVKKGKSVTFKAKAYGTGKSIRWSVSNKRASISKKGKFKAKKKGKVYVIIKSGNVKKKFLVKIK